MWTAQIKTNEIELYVWRKKEYYFMPRFRYYDPGGRGVHPYGYDMGRDMRNSTTKHVSKEEEAAIALLLDFSKRKNVHLSVHDLCFWRERLRAWLKGIKKTPAILIGKVKIEGTPTLEELEDMLART